MFSARLLLTLVAVLPFGPDALAARPLPLEQQSAAVTGASAMVPNNALPQTRIAQTGNPPAAQDDGQNEDQNEDQDEDQDRDQYRNRGDDQDQYQDRGDDQDQGQDDDDDDDQDQDQGQSKDRD